RYRGCTTAPPHCPLLPSVYRASPSTVAVTAYRSSTKNENSYAMYITDEQNHRITIFDVAGNFLSKWGVLGSGDGELNGPSGITIDADDNLYVVDQHKQQAHKFMLST